MVERRRRAVSVTLAVLLLLCDVIGYALARECNKVGCCYDDDRTHLTCSFSVPEINILLRGAPNLEEARILRGRSVWLKRDAVSSNHNLRRMLFSDIERLVLEESTEVQIEADRNVSLTVKDVGELQIRKSAFLGWHSKLATLSVTNADSVYVETDALPFDSMFHRVEFSNVSTLTLETGAIGGMISSLQLENVRSLRLSPGAISGKLGTLSLRNVEADACPPHAFGGSTDVLLRSVTLSSVESRCLDASGGWKRLAMDDCTLGHLSPRSIHGTIGNITVSRCRIASASPAAVSVNATLLHVSSTSVGELSSWALQVASADSVSLHRLKVGFLRRDALRGLQLTESDGGLSVDGLSVERAEPGALRLSAAAPVALTDLQLTGGCACSTPSWARQLLLGASNGARNASGFRGTVNTITEEQDALLRQIEAGNCTVEGISLGEFTAQHCGTPAGAGGLKGQSDDHAPLAPGWSYLGVAALASLLLALTVLLIIIVVRCCRRLPKSRSDRPWRSEPAGADCVGQHSAGGKTAPGSPGAYCRLVIPGDTGQSQAIYSEVADPPMAARPSESAHPNSPEARACTCPPTARYAVSADTAGCSCQPDRLRDAEHTYANMPGAGRVDASAADARADQDAAQSPLRRDSQVEAAAAEERGPVLAAAAVVQCPETDDLPEYAEIAPVPPLGEPISADPAAEMVRNELYISAV
ncbi:uncharacterized protein LOC122364495 [Amphibalanus amphitrite]|uniref:uncharacterized protein LOC122364495 n=1 Tax=Amphibalanus amphitrite TaxID=1232801 RepID=UPI001C924642|nr:uncharacterized protein LOC122364495 [Amphibalanus amphitrite]